MHDVSLVLQQVVNTFYDAPFAKHDSVPHGHESIPHVCPQSMCKIYSPVKEFLEKSLLDISPVCEYLAVKFLCEDRPHPFVPVVNVCSCKTKSYNLSTVITHKV